MLVRNFKIVVYLFSLVFALALMNCSTKAPQRKVTDDSKVSDAKDDEPVEEEEEEQEEPEEEVNEAPESNEPDKFDCGGDRIQESAYPDVSSCHEKGRFYDRSDDGGSCTKVKLAKIDCTEKGLKKKMTDEQKDDFDDALDGALEGYEVDQCIDCPPDGDEEFCEIGGKYKQGTVVFMVLEDQKKVKRTSFQVAGRPYQLSEKSEGPTCDVEESGDDDDDDDDDTAGDDDDDDQA